MALEATTPTLLRMRQFQVIRLMAGDDWSTNSAISLKARGKPVSIFSQLDGAHRNLVQRVREVVCG